MFLPTRGPGSAWQVGARDTRAHSLLPPKVPPSSRVFSQVLSQFPKQLVLLCDLALLPPSKAFPSEGCSKAQVTLCNSWLTSSSEQTKLPSHLKKLRALSHQLLNTATVRELFQGCTAPAVTSFPTKTVDISLFSTCECFLLTFSTASFP